MARGRTWASFANIYSFLIKKFILFPIPKSNGYEVFLQSSCSPGNEYIHVSRDVNGIGRVRVVALPYPTLCKYSHIFLISTDIHGYLRVFTKENFNI